MLPKLHTIAAVLFWLVSLSLLPARQFQVMVYNVENLFDADGIALFSDYQPENLEHPSPYSPRKLLTKIQNITQIARGFNKGAGPEIILFQEFELDRTPESTVTDYHQFLNQYAGTSVSEMLTDGFNPEIAGLPVEALVLKHFEDNGLSGYRVALPEPTGPLDQQPAHTNAVFTKFPLTYQKSHDTPNARTIQEVGLDIDGAELIIFNNHWKSGASNPNTEKQRVQNAQDLREAVEAVLERNPLADVIVGGDLNTYYNAEQHFPREHPDRWQNVDQFAIKVLGSQGDEIATRRGERMLYNLWFEVPENQRGSELYRGYWGTLMQILLTPGLYDGQGINYVDNSFRVIRIPGLNTTGPWNQPIAWYFTGEDGGGFGDHFPLAATFTTEPGVFRYPSHQSADGPATVPTADYRRIGSTSAPAFSELRDASPETLASNFGNVYSVEGELVNHLPFIVRVGHRDFEVYSYNETVVGKLAVKPVNGPIRFLGQLDEYRGRPQFVIHDPAWLR